MSNRSGLNIKRREGSTLTFSLGHLHRRNFRSSDQDFEDGTHSGGNSDSFVEQINDAPTGLNNERREKQMRLSLTKPGKE
jgi:hypothetical protein